MNKVVILACGCRHPGSVSVLPHVELTCPEGHGEQVPIRYLADSCSHAARFTETVQMALGRGARQVIRSYCSACHELLAVRDGW